MTATPLLLPITGPTPATGLGAAAEGATGESKSSFTGLLNQVFTTDSSMEGDVDLLAKQALPELLPEGELPLEIALPNELLSIQAGHKLLLEGQELPLGTAALPLDTDALPELAEELSVLPQDIIAGGTTPEAVLSDVPDTAKAVVATSVVSDVVKQAMPELKERGARLGSIASDTRGPFVDMAKQGVSEVVKAAVAAESQANMNSNTDADPEMSFDLKKGLGLDLAGERFKAAAADVIPMKSGVADVATTMVNQVGQMAAKMPQVATTTLSLDHPVGKPGWTEDLGSQIKWMANGKIQMAELRLNPQHLGPMEVRITVNNDQTSISFVSQHAAVREALDAALPRLRELMADSGIQLNQANVSDHSSQQARQNNGSQQEQRLAQASDSIKGGVGNEGDSGESVRSPMTHAGLGLLDTFA